MKTLSPKFNKPTANPPKTTVKWSHERNVLSLAKKTFGSILTGKAIRFDAVRWRSGWVDIGVYSKIDFSVNHVIFKCNPSSYRRRRRSFSCSHNFSLQLHSLLDAIIHSRIINDEKILKKVVKRFHNYGSLAFPLQPPTASPSAAAIDDARENFLIELASFHLSLKKAVLICEAEARQVEEYEKEKQRLGTSVIALSLFSY